METTQRQTLTQVISGEHWAYLVRRCARLMRLLDNWRKGCLHRDNDMDQAVVRDLFGRIPDWEKPLYISGRSGPEKLMDGSFGP